MNKHYQPQSLELDVQAFWVQQKSFQVIDQPQQEKYYCLSMFPYPSGHLHMGHVRNYTIGDVISRYQRMQGKHVLQPMGWDAFGLPAENAAIEHQVAPAQWTYANIDYMRKQLKRMGFGFDWSRELATCDPDYYRWEQWFFTQLMDRGLVYKKNAVVNWDPVDQTVLANEQVIDGRGWRSGALVERKAIPQWFLKITGYADQLLDDLDQLHGWPEQVRAMQSNWIGRSRGVTLSFEVAGHAALEVFTTRPDTLMGVTYIALAPQHPLALQAATADTRLADFIDQCRRLALSESAMATLAKQGMDTGYLAQHPLTGKRIPVWIANFVLLNYGTGAIMAVPGHDQRDWEFASQYELPIRQVIYPATADKSVDLSRGAYTDKGLLCNSGPYDELDFDLAFEAIVAELVRLGRGKVTTQYRLRDWGISRQRYWGTPIPVINCPDCGAVAVPQAQLPVELPTEVDISGQGSPLKQLAEFINTSCPLCEGPAQRETDTFDTFMESAWYYARYTSARYDQAMLEPGAANYWMPVDQYIGGIEHAILHLLYARFFHKLMRDFGLVHTDEPFKRLLCQGMVLADTYYQVDARGTRRWLSPQAVDPQRDEQGRIIGATCTRDGTPVVYDGMSKMSKSKRNGVDPQQMIEQYGADTVRLFMMFAAPLEQSLEWSTAGLEGAQRFIKRFWRQVHQHLEGPVAPALVVDGLNQHQQALRRKTHMTIAKVSDDLERRYMFNTAIAAVMELTNAISRWHDPALQSCAVRHEAWRTAVLLLAPIIPHVCHVLWRELEPAGDVLQAPWPKVDAQALVSSTINMVIQVNGKVRGKLSIDTGTDRDTIQHLALADTNAQRFIGNQSIRKIIVVPGKLVNIVVS